MSWSDWIECRFDSNGKIDTWRLEDRAPNSPGVYAIATKTGWSYTVQYIGMSGHSIWKRLRSHFSKKGNHVIRALLEDKESQGSATQMIDALYFAFCETPKRDARLYEALFINGTQPIGNLVGARLPNGLSEVDLNRKTERED